MCRQASAAAVLQAVTVLLQVPAGQAGSAVCPNLPLLHLYRMVMGLLAMLLQVRALFPPSQVLPLLIS